MDYKDSELETKINAIENTIFWDHFADHCFCWIYNPGMILAMIISWNKNHSILWAILHGILSWLYVVYTGLIKIF